MPDSSFFINKIGPVHASKYISTDQILLGSGAGPSKTGQRNRIATYSISRSVGLSEKPAERSGVITGEALLADDEDAPSSFAVHGDLVVAGVNESTSSRKRSGDNHHLRTFRLGKQTDEKGETTSIKTLPQHQIYDNLSVDLDDYQKVTKFSEDGKYIALISDEGIPAVVDATKMGKLPLDLPTTKVLDLEIYDGKLWIAEAKSIRYLSLPSGDDASVVLSLAQASIPKNFSLALIRVLEKDTLLLGLNDTKQNYSFLAIYKFRKGELVQDKIVHVSSKVRGLYVSTRRPTPSNPRLIAMTTSNGNLIIYDNDLDKLKTWTGLHQFPISTLAFRPDGKQLITCSIDEKVNVLDLINIGSEVSVLAKLLMLLISLLIAYLLYLYLAQSR